MSYPPPRQMATGFVHGGLRAAGRTIAGGGTGVFNADQPGVDLRAGYLPHSASNGRSGRTSGVTTQPVETGCTPQICPSFLPETALRMRMSGRQTTRLHRWSILRCVRADQWPDLPPALPLQSALPDIVALTPAPVARHASPIAAVTALNSTLPAPQ